MPYITSETTATTAETINGLLITNSKITENNITKRKPITNSSVVINIPPFISIIWKGIIDGYSYNLLQKLLIKNIYNL